MSDDSELLYSEDMYTDLMSDNNVARIVNNFSGSLADSKEVHCDDQDDKDLSDISKCVSALTTHHRNEQPAAVVAASDRCISNSNEVQGSHHPHPDAEAVPAPQQRPTTSGTGPLDMPQVHEDQQILQKKLLRTAAPDTAASGALPGPLQLCQQQQQPRASHEHAARWVVPAQQQQQQQQPPLQSLFDKQQQMVQSTDEHHVLLPDIEKRCRQPTPTSEPVEQLASEQAVTADGLMPPQSAARGRGHPPKAKARQTRKRMHSNSSNSEDSKMNRVQKNAQPVVAASEPEATLGQAAQFMTKHFKLIWSGKGDKKYPYLHRFIIIMLAAGRYKCGPHELFTRLVFCCRDSTVSDNQKDLTQHFCFGETEQVGTLWSLFKGRKGNGKPKNGGNKKARPYDNPMHAIKKSLADCKKNPKKKNHFAPVNAEPRHKQKLLYRFGDDALEDLGKVMRYFSKT